MKAAKTVGQGLLYALAAVGIYWATIQGVELWRDLSFLRLARIQNEQRLQQQQAQRPPAPPTEEKK